MQVEYFLIGALVFNFLSLLVAKRRKQQRTASLSTGSPSRNNNSTNNPIAMVPISDNDSKPLQEEEAEVADEKQVSELIVTTLYTSLYLKYTCDKWGDPFHVALEREAEGDYFVCTRSYLSVLLGIKKGTSAED